jgi:hypothetical protein
MVRILSRLAVPAVSIAIAVVTLPACSKDGGGTQMGTGGASGSAGAAGASLGTGGAGTSGMTGAGGMVGSGGAVGAGGVAGSGGVVGSGGAAGASSGGSAGATMSMDAGILGYVCEEQLAKLDKGGTGAADSACCTGLGKCTLASSVTSAGKSLFGHDTCAKSAGATDLLCAPVPKGDAAAAAAGMYATCTAKIGPTDYEGRCVPQCFLEGDPNASTLTTGSCMTGSLNLLCAPCFNPVDGKETGACSQAPNDKPKMPAPTPYATCGARDGGAALGTCVPKTIALSSGNPAAASLKQDDCSTADYVCTPTLKANNVNACFEKCQSGLTGAYADGACVPIYVATDVSPSALAFVKQTTCASGEVCAPCEDILNPGIPSHSCQ